MVVKSRASVMYGGDQYGSTEGKVGSVGQGQGQGQG